MSIEKIMALADAYRDAHGVFAETRLGRRQALYAAIEAALADAERAAVQEPVAWGRYPRFTGSVQKPEVVFTKPEGNDWVPLGPITTPPAAQPAAPLTRQQVQGLCESAGYDMATAQERADFINGIRHAEDAHGIKAPEKKGGTP